MGSQAPGRGTRLLRDGDVTFSRRTPSPDATNRLARALAERTRPFLDLTVTNPTAVDFPFLAGSLFAALGDPRNSVYAPDPKGLRSAREALAVRYAASGSPVDPERIVLTASSSESYSFLFKLLCDPGDVVLVPAPSYPLFDALAELENVELGRYPLAQEDDFRVHASTIAREVDRQESERKRVRAVILVNPNNPTGSSIGRGELDVLLTLAAERGFGVVSDEVFSEYRFADRLDDVRMAAAEEAEAAALVFSLGGLSKTAALPQLKLGWIVANGPAGPLRQALSRLEWIADTFLSVGTPVQIALPELLSWGAFAADAIRARLLANARALAKAFPAGGAATPLPYHAGWSVVLRLPAVVSEEDLVLTLLERHGLLVHPGYFFDFPLEAFLVLSLLPKPEDFAEGVERLRRALQTMTG